MAPAILPALTFSVPVLFVFDFLLIAIPEADAFGISLLVAFGVSLLVTVCVSVTVSFPVTVSFSLPSPVPAPTLPGSPVVSPGLSTSFLFEFLPLTASLPEDDGWPTPAPV